MTEPEVQIPPIKQIFEELFKEHFSNIYNYIFYHVRNIPDAEDLTADVFVRAYEYWGSYSCDKGSRGAWLGGIARNTVRTYFRKNASKPLMIELPEFISASADIEKDYLRKEELAQIFAQIDALDFRQRDLLTLKYLQHLSNRDIAKMLDMNESTVGVTLHRTIKKIQNNLQNV